MGRPARNAPEPEPAPGRSAARAPVGQVLAALAAGESALFGEGDLASARAHFDAAARAALKCGDAEGLARAALGLGGLWVHELRTAADAARVNAWQRHALNQLDPGSLLEIRLTVRLAAEADYAKGTSAEVLTALDTARATGDPAALAEALSLVHHCLLAPEHATLRLRLAEELLGLAGLTGRPIDMIIGLLWRTVDLLLAGDPHAERSLRELRDVNRKYALRAVEFVLEAIDVMRMIRQGDLKAAEQRAEVCAEHGRAAGDVDALGWHIAQLVAVRWFQGRIGELFPLLTEAAHSPTLAGPDDSLFAAMAVAAAHAGDDAEAASALQRLRGQGLQTLRQSSTWLVTIAGVAEAAALLGDGDLAAEAYALLKPYAARPIMASLAIACFGSVHHPLGVAALTMGRRDSAIYHFKAAVTANEGLAHRPALELSRRRLAELGVSSAESVMMPLASCRREGTRWRVELYNKSVLVADCVGMKYLALLLNHPGREISAAQLVGVSESRATCPDSLLDQTARLTYERRVRELQSEVDQAGSDPERRLRAEAELDWIVRELARATGLGGKSRNFLDAPERARTSVRKAICRALDRIRESDPELARELEADIVTGMRCCYRPRVSR